MDCIFWYWGLVILYCYPVVPERISPKLDFSSDEQVRVISNTSDINKSDDDFEVKHTIVVSTKLKNNNRGIHAADVGDDVRLIRPPTRKETNKRARQDDSGEVPVINGYLALESTQIQTPDSRLKSEVYPDSVLVNYNVDSNGYDMHPDIAADPRHWKPSTFYNNINWKSTEADHIVSYNVPQRSGFYRPNRPTNRNVQKKISDEGLKEYYCCKCKEMSLERKTPTRILPWNYESNQMKLDGKLTKLN